MFEPMESTRVPGRVRATIDRLVADGTAVSRTDGSLHSLFPVAIPPAEGQALGSWVAREGAIRTIEVGLGYGISALSICEALSRGAHPDARHVAIDPYQGTRFLEPRPAGPGGCRSPGPGGVPRHGVTDRIAEAHLGGSDVRPCFVDGNHRFDGIFVDVAFLARLVRPVGIVFLDDYQLPAIKKAASFFATNLGWSIEEISPPDDLHRWAVLRTSRQPDIRPYDWFVEF